MKFLRKEKSINISKKRTSTDLMVFYSVSYVAIAVLGVMCLLPFILIFSGSITAESSIFIDGYRLIPAKISFTGYKMLFKYPESLIRSYMVTIGLAVVGSALGLFLTTMTSYVLLRKDFPWRNGFAFYFFFTTLFSGGLVPWYILMVKYLHIKDNPLALLIPGLMNVFYILIMRNFMKSIPESVIEASRIDGAGDFGIYAKIVMPLSIPALATIGLFIALNYWNEWYNCLLFIDNENLFTLQYSLYKVLNSVNFAAAIAGKANVPMPEMPSESFKLVITVVATGPIIFLYPFVQKYFIKGITVGAVKG